ncbi:N-acetylglutamate synthase, GNAT family [Paenibacillus sp. 1_12]|nr:N-acetylglutamate synthase, GNAT family [Paenibacillus sp. 1_12]
MQDVHVKQVSFDNIDLSVLIAKLDAELLLKYPKEDIFGVDFEDPEIHKMTFVIAYCEGIAIGCGALRPLDPVSIELKRFFVDPSYRQRGIASLILHFLEHEAIRKGYSILRLEAGLLQPEAIAMYTRFGYDEIERFGEYVDSKQSVCFEKRL